ncbi:MAG TPA: protein-disulfide reductase DsbD family protein [Acidobacteriota bacterium]|nr:protein-disulfide reductase DsbD family protein [Acidobacteriota bacterium]
MHPVEMKHMRKRLAPLLVVLSICTGYAQDVVRFSLSDVPSRAGVGETFEMVVRAEIESGWHLYSMNLPPGGPVPTSLVLDSSGAFLAAGDVKEPQPIPWFDPNFGLETNYFADEVEFLVPVRVQEDAAPGPQALNLTVRFMACNEKSCLPPQSRTLTAVVLVQGGGHAGASEESGLYVPDRPAAGVESAETGAGGDESGIPAGTWAYIWFAMGMGALALLTPCVFPMIPITVSYFTKRNAQSRKRAVFEAGLYSIGIVLTFTLLGFLLTFLFGAGGINRLASDPLVNLIIAAVFIVFALSLFGALELALPSSWLSALSRESSRSGGIVGILLMALTFSLTSFTCTVPFVGTVMVAALQGDIFWSWLGVTAFAVVFAFPFFCLALFPSWLQSLPKSGNWMNSVKITMGFLELAAALKFLSNVDLVYQWEVLTRPVFLSIWLAIGLMTAMYLLGWFHLPHEEPSRTVGPGRVLFATFFLAVSFYLLRGLFGFGLGELDAFLPPRDYGAEEVATSLGPPAERPEDPRWFKDYNEALEAARQENRPLFVDFTGYTCTNCRWMEANMFPRPEVQELFRRYVLARLYTDGGKPEHEANRRLEQERFATIALPFYALISPEDEVLATFPGLTREPEEFVGFLETGLERFHGRLVSR